jgi:hypothetical protein
VCPEASLGSSKTPSPPRPQALLATRRCAPRTWYVLPQKGKLQGWCFLRVLAPPPTNHESGTRNSLAVGGRKTYSPLMGEVHRGTPGIGSGAALSNRIPSESETPWPQHCEPAARAAEDRGASSV